MRQYAIDYRGMIPIILLATLYGLLAIALFGVWRYMKGHNPMKEPDRVTKKIDEWEARTKAEIALQVEALRIELNKLKIACLSVLEILKGKAKQ